MNSIQLSHFVKFFFFFLKKEENINCIVSYTVFSDPLKGILPRISQISCLKFYRNAMEVETWFPDFSTEVLNFKKGIDQTYEEGKKWNMISENAIWF